MNGNCGIERIHIAGELSGKGSDRFAWQRSMEPAANLLYRQVFGPCLKPNESIIETAVDDSSLPYVLDKKLGIDLKLNLNNHMVFTVQEKVLKTRFNSLTVEYENVADSGDVNGDWNHCCADLVACIYADEHTKAIHSWIIVYWSMVKTYTQMGRILWDKRYNQKDGARASFKYQYFQGIPEACIFKCSDGRGHGFSLPEQKYDEEDSNNGSSRQHTTDLPL